MGYIDRLTIINIIMLFSYPKQSGILLPTVEEQKTNIEKSILLDPARYCILEKKNNKLRSES